MNETNTQPHRWHITFLTFAVAICIAVVMLSLVATIFYVKKGDDRRRDDQIASCERGNVIRAAVNDIIAATATRVDTLVFIDCPNVIH